MIDVRIGKVKVRRGTDVQRKLVTFEEGELVYTTDTKRAFIGDDNTLGGNVISNVNYITTVAGLPSNVVYGDILYVETTKKSYIVGYDTDGVTLKLFLIADGSIGDDLFKKINDLLNQIRPLTGCLASKEPPPEPPPNVIFEWVIQPTDQSYTNNVVINAVFTAKAKGPYEDIIYTWEKSDILVENWIPIPKAIGENLTILNAQQSDIAYYRCIATSQAGILSSTKAKLDIQSIEFKWSIQPQSYSTQINSPAQFIAEAYNTFNGTITYQWYKDDIIIAGATNKIYSIPRTFKTDIGKYKCVATTTYNGTPRSITSNIVDLDIGSSYILGKNPTVYIVSRAGEYIKWR
jgi:hypothetical protein